MLLDVTSEQLVRNDSAKFIRSDEYGEGPVLASTTSPDPVALALSGTVVTLLLLCLCCLCKFRGKPAPLPAADMSQPTMVVTQRTYFHSLSTDQPPPYTPPPEFPGNVGLWPPVALQKVPDTPPPPYSVTITHTAHVVPLSA
ncbi:uncharacterized protein LOC134532071 [Bacillus rossius redtenbacheri]|uniref:uncharacterized protein LOC134532071 n=1 Tax=Bacillus rossius redtenbacheri TaxID=93214 RepID=UPI002FDD7228